MKPRVRKALISLGVFVFWIGLWFLAARFVGKELLLPSPAMVVQRFCLLASGADFWATICHSLFRVLTGLISATVLGVILAVLTERSALLKALLSPVMTLVKSTPVASFIILALVWLGRSMVPIFISGLMVLPVVWSNVSAGIAAQDPLLLELAQVYGFPRGRIFRRITVPTVLPYFRSALTSALGLGWKAGIAAEVLTVPQRSIGKMIYESKLYLESTSLFAWTLTVILLSLLIERILLNLVRQIGVKGAAGHA